MSLVLNRIARWSSLVTGRVLCGIFLSILVAQFVESISATTTEQDLQGRQWTIPLHRQRVPVRSDDGIISFKSVYFGTIFLGAPTKQKFSVVFDTGSGHVIVPSMACNSETCRIHTRYDHALSELSTEIDYDGTPIKPGEPRDQITIAFGTGEVTGQFASDRLCMDVQTPRIPENATAIGDNTTALADLTEPPLGCMDMRIVMATAMSEEPFASFSFDGVLGLGLDALALAPQFSFFGVMTRDVNLKHPSFGVFLADSDDDFSEISFGGHNPERLKSELVWAPVAKPGLGYWQVRILAIRIGGRLHDFCDDGQCRAVVDTGTSLLAVPGSFADELKAGLEHGLQDPSPNVDSTVDCRKAVGQLLEFDIEGFTLELEPGDYARPSVQLGVDDDEATEMAATAALSGRREDSFQASEASGSFQASGASGALSDQNSSAYPVASPPQAQCRPTLMPIDLPAPIGPKLFILGEPVLKKYYTTYDWGQKRIGFGLAAHYVNDENVGEDLEGPLLEPTLL